MHGVLRADFDEYGIVGKVSSGKSKKLSVISRRKSAVFEMSDNVCHEICIFIIMQLCCNIFDIVKLIIVAVKWLPAHFYIKNNNHHYYK